MTHPHGDHTTNHTTDEIRRHAFDGLFDVAGAMVKASRLLPTGERAELLRFVGTLALAAQSGRPPATARWWASALDTLTLSEAAVSGDLDGLELRG